MTADEIRQEINTLTLAIEDSKKRQEGHLSRSHYYKQQEDKQSEWGTKIWSLNQRLALITCTVPVVGVIQTNHCNPIIYDEFTDAINATFEDAKEDHLKTCRDRDCRKQDHQPFNDDWQSDGDDTILLGDWVINDKGLWEPDKTPSEKGDKYAAISREVNTQVLWSERVVRVKSMCFQGCYPGQADLDSGIDPNGILTYALPEEFDPEPEPVEGVTCPQCDMDAEIYPLKDDPEYSLICEACGWKMNRKEKTNGD